MYDHSRLAFKIPYALYLPSIHRFTWSVNCTIDHKSLKGRGCWKSIHLLYLLAENTSHAVQVLFLTLQFPENRSTFASKNVFSEKRSPSFPMAHALTIILSSFFTQVFFIEEINFNFCKHSNLFG